MSAKDTNPKDAIAGTKVPLWLLSPIAKAKWALAMFSGMIKYGAWNWRRAGVRSSVYLSAAHRHLDAYESGEEVDPVDGTDHRANVMACMAILMDAEAAGKLNDDRPPSVGVRETYAECEALMGRLQDTYKDKSPRHYTIVDSEPPPCEGKASPVVLVLRGEGENAKARAELAESMKRLESALKESAPDYDLSSSKLGDNYCAVCDHEFCICLAGATP